MSMHDLLGLDPAEFVAARDRLARELKASGNKAEAEAVKALRRPSVPVWALNQVAREHSGTVDALLAATASARSALGGDGDELREALRERRAALRAVVQRAREVVDASGRSGDAQEREIESALNAVVDSEELTQALQRGELIDVHAPDDGEDLTAMFAPVVDLDARRQASRKATATKQPATRPPAKKPPPPKKPTAREIAAEKKRAAAHADVVRLEKAAAEAADRVASAQRAATKADEALERARRALAALDD